MVEKRVEDNLRTSQMADDALNVDFLNWLKKWGPNAIIVLALIVIGFQGVKYLSEKAEDRRSEAWRSLEDITTPRGLQESAVDHEGVGSISVLARLKAADLHYADLLKDEPLEADALSGGGDALSGGDDDASLGGDLIGEENGAGGEGDLESGATDDQGEPIAENETEGEEGSDETAAEEDEGPKHMSEADRADILSKMEGLYQQVIDETTDDPSRDILLMRALFGQATVAEMRLDSAAARDWYTRAATVAGDIYPKYAALAAARMADMDEANVKVDFITQAELAAINEAKRVPELLERPEVGPTADGVPVEADPDKAAGDETLDATRDEDEATEDGGGEDDDDGGAEEEGSDDDDGGGV